MLLANFALNVRDLAAVAADEVLAHLFPGAAPVHDAAPACPIGRRLHVATDGVLCRHHLEELGTWLRDIEREAGDLDPYPQASIRYDGGSSSALPSHRSPAHLDAIAYTDRRTTAQGWRHHGPVCWSCLRLAGRSCTCPPLEWRRAVHWPHCRRHGIHPSCVAILADRDEHEAHAAKLVSVFETLHGLAQRVRDERLFGLPVERALVRVPPGHEGVYVVQPDGTIGVTTLVPATLTIRTERDLLTRQLEWIADQEWAPDMYRELAGLREQLQRANHNEDDQPLPGYCYRLVDGVECGGNLWPAEPLHTSGYEATDGTRAVECDRPARHHYEGGDLARLSVVVARQQRADDQADVDVPTAPATSNVVIPDAPSATNPKNAGGRLVSLLATQEEEPAS